MFGIEISIGASYLAMSDLSFTWLCMACVVVAWLRTRRS